MFKRILPHICIDTAVIFLVLWVIDRFNNAMHFLARDTFKIPFFVFLILVITESVILIVYQRREPDITNRSPSRDSHAVSRHGPHSE